MDDNDGEEKDDVKRKSRNLSEKKRRDQFNLLVSELSSMVTSSSRKMDKSTVLKAAISFFRNQKEATSKTPNKSNESWQPPYLSNEEFAHLMLEALDGFVMTISCSGNILYTSDSITPLLGHLPVELNGTPLWSLMPHEEQDELRRFLSNPALTPSTTLPGEPKDRYTIMIHLQKGGLFKCDPIVYERIHLTGYFDKYNCSSEVDSVVDYACSESEDAGYTRKTSRLPSSSLCTMGDKLQNLTSADDNSKHVFVAVGRLEQPHLLREMLIMENSRTEFTSRHSLEWKFLFLDHRAPTVIGYLPFEVLGTSGFDYYHVDDLEKVAACHNLLLKTGKGTSCHYRFLTKGQQWIWLQTQYYITYHQWNSKPEFIVCTNAVISYGSVLKKNIQNNGMEDTTQNYHQNSNDSVKSIMQCVPTNFSDNPTKVKKCDPKTNLSSVRTTGSSQESDHQYGDSSRKLYANMSKYSKGYGKQQRLYVPKETNSKRMKINHSKMNSLRDQYEAKLINPRCYTASGVDNTPSLPLKWPRRQVGGRTLQTSPEMTDMVQPVHAKKTTHVSEYNCIRSPASVVSNASIGSEQQPQPKSEEMHENFEIYQTPERPVSYDGDLRSSEIPMFVCPTKKSSPILSVPSGDQLELPSTTITSNASPRHEYQNYHDGMKPSCGSELSLDPSEIEERTSPNVQGQTQLIRDTSQPISSAIRVLSSLPSHTIPTPSVRNASPNLGLSQSMYITPEQQQLQNRLRRKHAELQQQIMKQQEELKLLNQQLIMTEYGINPSEQKSSLQFDPSINSGLSYAPVQEDVNATINNGCYGPTSNCEPQQYPSFFQTNANEPRNNHDVNLYINQSGNQHLSNTYCIDPHNADRHYTEHHSDASEVREDVQPKDNPG